MMSAVRAASALLTLCGIAACAPGTTLGSDASPGRDAALLDSTYHDASRDLVAPDVVAENSLADSAPDVATTPDVFDEPALPDVHDAGTPHACPSSSPMNCAPGTGTGNADQCFDAPSCYLTRVQQAVRAVLNDHPEWFDYNNPLMCPAILNVDGFLDAVVANLQAAGLCAIRDPNAPGEEISVKHDNDFSENFDLVSSANCARYGALIYTGYCTPAWW